MQMVKIAPTDHRIHAMFLNHFCHKGGIDLLFDHCHKKHNCAKMPLHIQDDRRQVSILMLISIFQYRDDSFLQFPYRFTD